MPDPGVQRGGSVGIFGAIKDRIGENIQATQQRVDSSLNRSANLGTLLPKAPEIDPLLSSAIDQAFATKLPDMAQSIFENSGLAELLKQAQSQTGTKETTEKKTETASKKTSSSATQETNKPVETAGEEREEGRSNIEQMFLDLVNGKLDLKL